MKLYSKSIFSPGHSREPPPQMSISSSFNKKLVTNGQASPMFPTVSVGRKRGSGFDNPEPSSPKVTCIGQVRVKAKKRGARSKSKRRSGGGEASFRRAEVGVNPDLSRQKSQRSQSFQQQQQDRNQRWVHLPLTICEALKELSCLFPCKSSCTRDKEEKGGGGGEEGIRSRWMVTMQEGKREIELVMGEEEQEEEGGDRRRHVFEDIDLDDIEKLKNEENEGKEEEEKGRVSICIPPKNALLLMRCRSDPVKVAALANKFLEQTLHKQEDDVEVPMEEDKQVHESEKCVVLVDTKEDEAKQETNEVDEVVDEEAKAEKKEDDDENGSEKLETISEDDVVEKGSKDEEVKGTETEEEEKGSRERENRSNLERGSGRLPECLLLMMCEPKLSIEVSKETWLCTADFVRWLPPRPAAKSGSGDRQAKKRVAVESKPPPPVIQPGRSSCSFPAPVVGPNVCEPDMLKRCKSEPRGSAAAKLAPEGCFWNNRKLMEPYSSARLGIGAAGVGF